MTAFNENDLDKWIFKYWTYLLINGNRRKSTKELKNDERLIRRMRRLAKLCENYNESLVNKYGIKVDIVDCWLDTLHNSQINIIFESEDVVIKYLILYAKWQSEKFNAAIESTESELLETIKIERQNSKKPIGVEDNNSEITYDELFAKETKKEIVDKALIDLNIVSNKGTTVLTNRQKGQVCGFIEILLKYDYLPNISRDLIANAFYKKLALKEGRFKNDSNQFAEMLVKANNYFKIIVKQ
ncbi:hypothetical protein [Spirosoma panaciterrae]|uniref:hypothetical protein n=1 Tax=Spirosoma panaciterrae TaxID=496058 RepID=UPI00037C50B5|nr:hypothetical protein [Spirosoma panaciterrae]